MTITLSNGAAVELHDQMTFGMKEDLKNAAAVSVRVHGIGQGNPDIQLNPDGLGEATFRAAQIMVKSVKDKDGKDIVFTHDWLRELSVEDGEAIYEAVDQVTSKKK